MSTVKMIELYENTELVTATTRKGKRLAKWVGRHLRNIRMDTCQAYKITVDTFCSNAGITKKTMYELERGESSPGVDTVQGILEAAHTDFAEFFHTIVTYERLTDIHAKLGKDIQIIDDLVNALGHPNLRTMVEGAAASVSGFLRRETTQQDPAQMPDTAGHAPAAPVSHRPR